MKALRRAGVSLAVLIALFVGANVIATRVAEDHIGDAVRAELRLSGRPAVSVSGFPILFHILAGDVPKVSIDARDFLIQGLQVLRAHVVLEGIHSDDLLGGHGITVTVARGSATADTTDRSVDDFLRSRHVDVTIAFVEGSVVVRATKNIFGRSRMVVATGPVRIDGRKLVFAPTHVTVDGQAAPPSLAARAREAVAISVAIPRLPGGITADGVETHQGYARFVATLRNERIRLG